MGGGEGWRGRGRRGGEEGEGEEERRVRGGGRPLFRVNFQRAEHTTTCEYFAASKLGNDE